MTHDVFFISIFFFKFLDRDLLSINVKSLFIQILINEVPRNFLINETEPHFDFDTQ